MHLSVELSIQLGSLKFILANQELTFVILFLMFKIILRIILYFSIWILIEKVLRLDYPSSTWSVIIVGFEAAFIGLNSIRNTRDQLEINLFMQFNNRYSELNQDIQKLFNKKLIEIDSMCEIEKAKNLKVIEDYINLCCEEYYCYKIKNQIPIEIWQFWHEGIMYNLREAICIKEYWDREFLKSNSFYVSKYDHPFRQEAKFDYKSSCKKCFILFENYLY